MKARNRFIKSVIQTARQTEAHALPWSRGATRAETLARRTAYLKSAVKPTLARTA